MKQIAFGLFSIFSFIIFASNSSAQCAQWFCAAACGTWSTQCVCSAQQCVTASSGATGPNCTATVAGVTGSCSYTVPNVNGHPGDCSTGSCTLCYWSNGTYSCPGYVNPCWGGACSSPPPTGSGTPQPTATPPPPPVGDSWCSVTVNGPTTVNEGGSFSVTLQGVAEGGGAIALRVAKADGTQIPGQANETLEAGTGIYSYWLLGTAYQSTSVTLPVGNYQFFCNANGATNPCFGNPWRSCTTPNPVPASPPRVSCGTWISCGANSSQYVSVTTATTTVQARVFDDPTLTCSTATPYSAGTSGTVFMTATDGGTSTPVSQNITGTANFTLKSRLGADPYTYSSTFNPVGSVGVSCIRSYTVEAGSASVPATVDFFVTTSANPWWQMVGGAARAAASVISNIPAAATNRALSLATASIDSGMAVAGDNDVTTGGVSVGGVSGTNFAIKNQLNSGRIENFAYWHRQTGLLVPSFSWTAGSPTIFTGATLTGANVAAWTKFGPDGTTKVIPINGNVSLETNLNTGAAKVILLVNGSVTVPGNVSSSGFLMVVAKNSITFGPESYVVDGVYVTDGLMTISDAGTAVGVARQFLGRGVFVGFGGVTMRRDLGAGLTNNTDPGTVFSVNPAMLLKTPEFMKRGIREWREVAPTGGE